MRIVTTPDSPTRKVGKVKINTEARKNLDYRLLRSTLFTNTKGVKSG